MIYKGLYRTMFIVTIVIASIYLGLSLLHYIQWQTGSTYYASSQLFKLFYFLRAFLPFSAALATLILAMFALIKKELAAMLTVGLLLITYGSHEAMNFLIYSNDLHQPTEIYFFNPLLAIGIVTVALLTSFTIYWYLYPKN
ncbi:MAG: hypothetical protein ACRCWD_03500 [Culicoidibacterales bacterium]